MIRKDPEHIPNTNRPVERSPEHIPNTTRTLEADTRIESERLVLQLLLLLPLLIGLVRSSAATEVLGSVVIAPWNQDLSGFRVQPRPPPIHIPEPLA